jgi:hypothetical protein
VQVAVHEARQVAVGQSESDTAGPIEQFLRQVLAEVGSSVKTALREVEEEGDSLAQVRHDVRCRMRPRGPQIGQNRSDVRQRPPGRILRQRETRTEALQQQGTSVEVAVQQPYDVGRVGRRGERGGLAGGDPVIRRQLEHD